MQKTNNKDEQTRSLSTDGMVKSQNNIGQIIGSPRDKIELENHAEPIINTKMETIR